MLYFTMDFGELNNDGLIDTAAKLSAVSEADLRKNRLLAPETFPNVGQLSGLQTMVMNGISKKPSATIENKFGVEVLLFEERFIVLPNITSSRNGLLFLQKDSTILDMRQGVLSFPHFLLQLKHGENRYSFYIKPLRNPTNILFQPGKQTVVYFK